ncbi:uncharacterized protein LOC111083074 [Limulus polyphemus]|uniref:Uncharacterized protein LOC111083074 n=1 Tax=Limulus polyphemus TaxID=6850 RepID=A0ABM1RUG8_LIMPO|nr:uncharacterized protein LOC111083074 [Limulus polyphemus]
MVETSTLHSATSRYSFRQESVGANVLIIVGLSLSFFGLAMTLAGVYVEFTHSETQDAFMGIGPSLIGIGVFFLFLRLFFCPTYIGSCCKGINRLFPTKNVINPRSSSKGTISRTTSAKSFNRKSPLVAGASAPGNTNVLAKPAVRSINKPSTIGKVNFLPEEETKDTKIHENRQDWEANTAGQSLSDILRPTTEDKFINVVNVSREQELQSGNVENRLNAESKSTKSNSLEFLDDFSETIRELGLK